MNKAQFEVDILVDGKPVKQFFHKTNHFIEAKIGSSYSVRIKNNSYSRALAVVTVDGLNVISGLPQGNERGLGYIVSARDSLTIEGFRKNLQEVGSFEFCKKEESYCNEQGLAGNNGVIGVRIYNEKPSNTVIYNNIIPFHKTPPLYVPPFDSYPYMSWSDNTSYSNSDGPDITVNCVIKNNDNPCRETRGIHFSSDCLVSMDVGTTWGKKINSGAFTSEFEAEDSFVEFIIYYNSRKNLEKMGIPFKKETVIALPKAFCNFATPPKNWNG